MAGPNNFNFRAFFLSVFVVCLFYTVSVLWWISSKKTNGELGVRLECQPTSCMCFDSWIKFEELMLNAVALNAILDVDEFLGS